MPYKPPAAHGTTTLWRLESGGGAGTCQSAGELVCFGSGTANRRGTCLLRQRHSLGDDRLGA